jgi:uncharacterized membrane protein YraQ (UPF0718 family)
MNNKRVLLILLLLFLAAYFIPFSAARVQNSLIEAFLLLQEYARKHVLLCLVPAFFIAGAISVFIRKEAVIKYLGPSANKVLSYGVASVSGSILAVSSFIPARPSTCWLWSSRPRSWAGNSGWLG